MRYLVLALHKNVLGNGEREQKQSERSALESFDILLESRKDELD